MQLTQDHWETAALGITAIVAITGIIYLWWRAPLKEKKWLKKLRSGLILVFLWVRAKQQRAPKDPPTG